MSTDEDWVRAQKLGMYPKVASLKIYNELVLKGTAQAERYFIQQKNIVPTREDIQNIHYLTFREVHSWAGQFREPGYEVAVGNVNCTLSTEIEKSLDSLKKGVESVATPNDSKEKSMLWNAHYHVAFEGIHPFADGNGRVGRIILGVQIAKTLKDKKATLLQRKEYISAIDDARATSTPVKLATLLGKNRFSAPQVIKQHSKSRGASVVI